MEIAWLFLAFVRPLPSTVLVMEPYCTALVMGSLAVLLPPPSSLNSRNAPAAIATTAMLQPTMRFFFFRDRGGRLGCLGSAVPAPP